MKLLLLSILVSLQTLIAKALENDLQFQCNIYNFIIIFFNNCIYIHIHIFIII